MRLLNLPNLHRARITKIFIVLVFACFASIQVVIPLVAAADPMSADEIKALNQYPNWVADTCNASGTTASAPTGSDTLTPGNEVPDDQLAGSTDRAKIWNYLIAQGWTPVQAAGIMGNIYAEGGFKNGATNIEDPAGHTQDPSNLTAQNQGYGLVGFTPGASLLTNSPIDWSLGGKSPVKVTKSNVYYISTQLDVVYYFMKNYNNEMQDYINQATSPSAAALAFMNIFENPATQVAHEPKRENAAERAMRDFGNNAPSGDSTLSANNAAPVDISDVMDKYNLQSAMIQQVNGDVIAAASAHQPPTTPASTMKLIIADTALRSGLDLSKTVAVTPDLYYAGQNDLGSSRVTLEDALQSMLSQSSNVGANVLMKAMGGVNAFTQKAQGYGYNDTNVGGYYDPSNDGKNTSTIADEVSAMNHIFSTNGSDYQIAQDALRQAAKNDNFYGVDDDANKWAGTSDVAGNVGLFTINGSQYIIGLYYNGSDSSSQAKDAIKNGSADLAALVKNSPAAASATATTTCSCPAGGSTGTVALTGNDNEEKTWNFLKAAGLSDAAAAGIMGNLQQESGFNPEVLESGGTTKNPGSAGHTGYGLAQWYADEIENKAKDNSVNGPIYLLATQLSLVLAQMKGTSPTGVQNIFDAMKNMTDPAQAAAYFDPHFEGGTDPNGVRESNATTIFHLFQGKGGGAAAAAATVTGGSGSCGNPSGLSPNCQAATGSAKILCAAKQYDTVSYSQTIMGGNHLGSNKAWLKLCPTIGPKCYLDCSGLVNIAVYDAFGDDLQENTYGEANDHKNWQRVQFSQLQPGDLLQPGQYGGEHVEIVDHVSGNTIYTFGAHTDGVPQPQQVGSTSYPKSSGDLYLHWIGPGSTH